MVTGTGSTNVITAGASVASGNEMQQSFLEVPDLENLHKHEHELLCSCLCSKGKKRGAIKPSVAHEAALAPRFIFSATA